MQDEKVFGFFDKDESSVGNSKAAHVAISNPDQGSTKIEGTVADPQQAAPQQADPQQADPQQAAPQQAAPQQAAPQQAAPQQAAPQQAAPQQAVPQQAAPQQAAPEQAAPEQAAPQQAAPPQGNNIPSDANAVFGSSAVGGDGSSSKASVFGGGGSSGSAGDFSAGNSDNIFSGPVTDGLIGGEDDVIGEPETHSLGDMIRRPLEKFVGTSGMKQRISLVLPQYIHGKIHWYKEAKKRFFCLTTDPSKPEPCCQRLGKPTQYFAFLIIVYTCNREGVIVSDDYAIQCLRLPFTKAQQFQQLNIREGKFYPIDLIVKTTNEQFQNLEFNYSGDANWLKAKDKIVAEAKEKMSYVEPILGERMSLSAFLAAGNTPSY